ncbi:hypothetical protein I79_014282 [Cricetulus griseus]|uniref:Uncharacterized protein n=1 Tax=Cricetulus griseus TaxID=10029 RepID=G3HTQ4_CRIGR|nr:hypothetical protein I79_014282 [Cricetulus griseus]
MTLSGACRSLRLNIQGNVIELGVTSQPHQPNICSTGQPFPTELLSSIKGIN